MDDYSGLSRAVREEIEQRSENEKLEQQMRQMKETPTTEPNDESFWQRLRDSITLLTNKAPK
jgi:hypothetical protein